MDRRKFLKYAGATGAVVGASALGLNYLSKPQSAPPSQGTTTATATTTLPSTAILPMITRLTYEPSRALNSKIYDIRVDLKISNPARRLLSVQVALEPVVYAYLPSEAFPNEQSKATMLQTTGLESELLFAYFTNLKGGREYDVKATVNDSTAMVDARTLRTEYVREFENIAPLDDLSVIADYYTWYPPGGWGDHVYIPLLGEYSSGDPIVISKHIDWATGYGIDAFAASWWGTDYTQTETFEKAFLNHAMLNQIKFHIIYENNGRLKIQNPDDSSDKWIQDLDDPFNRETLISDFLYLTKYFSSPQYLKIDGKPCVTFDYTLPFRGDVEGAFTELRRKVREGGWEMYLVNDLMARSFYPEELISGKVSLGDYTTISPAHILDIIKNTDAISGGPPPFYEMDVRGTYGMWHNFAMKYEKDFVSSVWPGLHIHPSVCANCQPIPRSPEKFRMLLEVGREYSTKKIIGIHTFNEWTYANQVEPAEEYGLTYLEVLKEVLAKTKT